MSEVGITSHPEGYEARVDSEGRLSTKSDSFITSPEGGYQALVDSGGRLHTRSDCSPRTVTTTRGSFSDSGATTLVSAVERCYLMLQNHGPSALLVNLEGDDPDDDDLVVTSGGTLTIPFPFATAVKGKGVGGSGTYVAIEASPPA